MNLSTTTKEFRVSDRSNKLCVVGRAHDLSNVSKEEVVGIGMIQTK